PQSGAERLKRELCRGRASRWGFSRRGRLRLMLRTVRLLPLEGLLTLGFDTGRFPPMPPACYRASWQLPGPDLHRQATTSLRLPTNRLTRSTSSLLDARQHKIELLGFDPLAEWRPGRR